MTIRISQAELDDRVAMTAIDQWLDGQSAATPFHRPGWVKAISEACRHPGHYLVARDQGDTIQGVLPLHLIRSRLFGTRLISSGFAVDGGIIAADPAIVAQLAEQAWAQAAALGCNALELRGGMMPDDRQWHIDTETYAGFARPLAQDDDAELKTIPRKQRAEVRRALGLSLDIKIGRESIDLKQHYQVYAESVRNLGTPVFPKSLFAAMLDAFGEAADILTVLHDGAPVASVLSLYHRSAVMPYWGGGTAMARTLRANDMLYFALMRHARGRGCTMFDFGRSKQGTGAFAFKKNWGFTPEPLRYAARTAGGGPPLAINPLNPKYRLQIAMWQKLPLPLANRLGPLIARGLG